MKSLRIFFILLIVFFSFENLSISQTTITGDFDYDNLSRNYRLYVPSSYNPAIAAPLVINLHGYGSNNIEQEFYGDFRPIADTAGFLVVHPNGTPDNTNTMHWNTFGTSNVDDVGFLSALIDTIGAHYNLDSGRIYSTGMSNGGFMSYSLACSLSSRIAAIASVTGSMVTTNFAACVPLRPLPVMQIHGTADGTVPYNGNQFFVPVATLLNYWIGHNNCETDPIITQVPDINTMDGCTAEHYFYGGGEKGSTVEHYKIIGGGHSWPGALVNINVTNMDFSASKEIWRFLSKYSLDGLISNTSENIAYENLITAYPNPSNGMVQLQFVTSGEKTIGVYNNMGQMIDNFKSANYKHSIVLPTKGLFLITVERDGFLQTIKVINR
ncbi:MAG: hypothetical protein CVT92_04470 [Bacteroidetes bacterium HGW-Bacteroidetes-1]|jgi:polyhydroxybutyrate depolymerase|nr:MAG: hypothetical protein CVT92_04470 [Bacteroidetes bacterium HGW-Bacteroidetes-1]